MQSIKINDLTIEIPPGFQVEIEDGGKKVVVKPVFPYTTFTQPNYTFPSQKPYYGDYPFQTSQAQGLMGSGI